MGKFKIKKIEKREKQINSRREELIKLSLSIKPLLTPIPETPTKKHPLQDGILLFGKHRGRKISELLKSYEFSAYVTDYLMLNEDLPKKFRKQIEQIIDNQDPFDDDNMFTKKLPLKTRIVEDEEEEIKSENIWEDKDEEDIPW
jgi:hypothetical protein